MTLTEMSVAAKMMGMSYGKYVYLLRQDKITPPSIEEVRENMANCKARKQRTCAECGKIIANPTSRQKFCCTNCRVKHKNKKSKANTVEVFIVSVAKDETKQCEKCIYWYDMRGSKDHEESFCHYMLNTGNRRVEIDGVCQSRCTDKRKKKRKYNPFTME